jgi:hypothetical protein
MVLIGQREAALGHLFFARFAVLGLMCTGSAPSMSSWQRKPRPKAIGRSVAMPTMGPPLIATLRPAAVQGILAIEPRDPQ